MSSVLRKGRSHLGKEVSPRKCCPGEGEGGSQDLPTLSQRESIVRDGFNVGTVRHEKVLVISLLRMSPRIYFWWSSHSDLHLFAGVQEQSPPHGCPRQLESRSEG